MLLNSCFENEDALASILSNCALSAIVFQERIHNEYYLKITPDQKISDDLQDILNQSLLGIIAIKYLNLACKVGPVAEMIRKLSPKTLEEWKTYYFKNAYPKEHLEELGRRLYIKITEVCTAEIESITEEDCINFIINLVINRTYDGYQSEIQTIYG